MNLDTMILAFVLSGGWQTRELRGSVVFDRAAQLARRGACPAAVAEATALVISEYGYGQPTGWTGADSEAA